MSPSRILPAVLVLAAAGGFIIWLNGTRDDPAPAAAAGRRPPSGTDNHHRPGPAAPAVTVRPTAAASPDPSAPTPAATIPPAASPAGPQTPEPSEAPAAPPVVRRRFAPAPAAARLPLVFALPPEEFTGLNPRQSAAAIAIADQFSESMGGESADPDNPDYRNRWKREQPLADYQLRAAIGAQAFARWQEEAYLRAKADAAK